MRRDGVSSAMYDSAKHGPFAAEPKPGKKVLDELRIKKSENGGHVVTHSFRSEGGHVPYEQMNDEVHAFGKSEGKKMLAHVAEHMNVKQEEPKATGGEY